MCVEPREGRLYIFMPPVAKTEHYLDLAAAVEETAANLKLPVIIEGTLPPHDYRLNLVRVAAVAHCAAGAWAAAAPATVLRESPGLGTSRGVRSA